MKLLQNVDTLVEVIIMKVIFSFMEKANEFAKSLGCTDTYYRVPDGLAYDNHYTTASDLVILSKAALENPIMMRYASTATEHVTYASGHTITWNNTNLFDIVNGLTPTKSFFPIFKRDNYELFDFTLDKKHTSNNSETKEQKFIELFYQSTATLAHDKLNM